MINLLPTDLKESYYYARKNYRLRRWVTIFGFSLLGALLLTAGGAFYLNTTTDTYVKQIAVDTDQLQKQSLPIVQKQVTDISNNLKLVVQVLSKEVLFSKLLGQLASLTPSNAVLTGIAILQTQGGIDITAQTADYNAGTQLQVNLADPKNKIFGKADIVSITCLNSAANPQYPCTATIRALFAANNPFLFINNATTKAKS